MSIKKLYLRLNKVVKTLAAEVGLDSLTSKYVLKRLRAEGLTFLTKTLPKLSKSVLYSIETGKFERKLDYDTYLTDFAWKGRSLVVFTSLLQKIFDPNGFVLESAGEALRLLRTFCDYLYKLALDFTDEDRYNAAQKYLDLEQNLASVDVKWAQVLRRNFETYYKPLAEMRVHDFFEKSRPRFTSGKYYESSTVQSVLGHHWNGFKRYNDGIVGTCDSAFSAFTGYFRAYPSAKTRVKIVKSGRVCKVLFVPKDSRGPRVISKEPLHVVRAQMSFFDTAIDILERITGNRINFRKQEVNRSLAKEGSINKSKSTMDLKDASDSVLYSLCKEIAKNAPGLRWFLSHSRSAFAEVPSVGPNKPKTTIRLRKLAGMGSGLTFPIMALVIHLSVCSHVVRRTGYSYPEVAKDVYVYGDDLIVPSRWSHLAVEALKLSQLKCNVSKSFTNGFFRESCGGDYFKGHDVTPVRLKLSGADLDSSRTLAAKRKQFRVNYQTLLLNEHGIYQLERHCRELIKKKFFLLAEFYYHEIERALNEKLPFVSEESPVLGRFEPNGTPLKFTGKYYVPTVPKIALEEEHVCPYKFLGGFLKSQRDAGSEWANRLFPSDSTEQYGIIAESRIVKLSKRLVHASAL